MNLKREKSGSNCKQWAVGAPLFAAVFLLASATAHGQTGTFEAADQTLNQAYRATIKSLSPQASAALRAAQRTWITLRDANAACAASMPSGGEQAASNQKALDSDIRVDFLRFFQLQPGVRLSEDVNSSALQNADRQLNEAYRELLASLPGVRGEALRKAQRAWVTTRDADLAALTAAGVVRNERNGWAMLRLWTEQRVAFFHSVVEQPILRMDPRMNPVVVSKPPNAQTAPVSTRIKTGKVYSDLMLDMHEMLLAGMEQGSIDFWDVRTGALIRTVNPQERARALTNLGGGFVSVQSEGRHIGDLEVFERTADERLLVIGSANEAAGDEGVAWGLVSSATETGTVAVLDGSGLGEGCLWLGNRSGKWQAYHPPGLGSDKRWEFVALASDGKSVALAREAKVATFKLPGGQLDQQVDLPAGTKAHGLCADGKGGFLVRSISGDLYQWDSGSHPVKLAGQLPIDQPPKPAPDSYLTWPEPVSLVRVQAGWLAAWRHGDYDRIPKQIQLSRDAPDPIRHLVESWVGDGAFAIDSGGEFAAVSRKTGLVELYHLPSGQLVRTFGTQVPKFEAVLGGDGRRVITWLSTPDSSVKVNVLDLEIEEAKTFEAKGFDRVLGVDRTGNRVVLTANRELGPRDHDTRFTKHARTIVASATTAPKSIGILDLSTGTVSRETLPAEAGSWQFSPQADLLIGALGTGPRTRLVLLDPFAKDGVTTARSTELQTALTFQRGDETIDYLTSIALSSDGGKAAHSSSKEVAGQPVYEKLDFPVYLYEMGKAGNASVRSWTTPCPEPPFIEDSVLAFSHDGHRIATFNGSYKNGGSNVCLIDTAKNGSPQWIVEKTTQATFVAFSGNDRRILIGGDGDRTALGRCELHLLDAATGKTLSSLQLKGSVASAAIDGTRVLIDSAEGGYHLIAVHDDQLVDQLRYVPGADGSYALVLPDGHYLSTSNAHQRICFSQNGQSQPAESLDIKFNRPDLVASELGATPELVKAFRRAYEKRLARLSINERDLSSDALPPTASIDYGKVPLTTAEPGLKLAVDVRPGTRPLTALEATANDVPVLGRDGCPLQGVQTKGFAGDVNIQLATGNNKITVWARDANGLTSSRISVNVTLTAKARKQPALYVLAAGINDYPSDDHDLALAVKDASDISNVFEQNARSGFSAVKKKLLLDAAASRQGILDARAFFAEADVNDQAVIFMSGHGLLDADYEYRYCPADIDLNRVSETTLTYSEIESLFDQCHARKRLLLLDTCHAGEADRDDRRQAEAAVTTGQQVRAIPFQPFVAKGVSTAGLQITDLLERHFVDLRIGAGAAVLASSTAQQSSFEAAEVNNGLFSSAVILGLRLRKADLDGDGIIRASELLRFCQEEVRRISQGRQDPVARHVNLVEDFAVLTYR